MIKIEEKTDKGYFAALRELLELYKKGAKAGNYYKILPQDIVAEGISLEGRETLSSEEEGLRELARVIYYAATGIWEYNDPSIKLDGYPKIDSMMWPILQIMLSKGNAPSIEEIEKSITEVHDGADKNIKQAKSLKDLLLDEGCTVHIVEEGEEDANKRIEAGSMIVLAPEGTNIFSKAKEGGDEIHIGSPDKPYARFPLKEFGYKVVQVVYGHAVILSNIETGKKIAGRDAGKYLDEVSVWLNKGLATIDSEHCSWKYYAEASLVNMLCSSGETLMKNGFIDEYDKETVYSPEGSHICGEGIGELKEKLKDKRIVSVCDKSKCWFLVIS
ncbi:MAG: hypothetical protein WC788_01765 [Candidatus Paceibacterota bacterium]|jgi:hypothetical protein